MVIGGYQLGRIQTANTLEWNLSARVTNGQSVLLLNFIKKTPKSNLHRHHSFTGFQRFRCGQIRGEAKKSIRLETGRKESVWQTAGNRIHYNAEPSDNPAIGNPYLSLNLTSGCFHFSLHRAMIHCRSQRPGRAFRLSALSRPYVGKRGGEGKGGSAFNH